MTEVAGAQRLLVWLTAVRWLPVGVVLGVTVLLPLERGLTVAQIGGLLAIQGFVVLLLELPTGALSDTLGRRPVLVASGALATASSVLFLYADSWAMFAASLLLQGVFRALDSGSLESWFVDTAHAHDPDLDLAGPLSKAGTALGASIAAGALLGGVLVAWDPLPLGSALLLPLVLAILLYAGYTALVVGLVRDAPRDGPAARNPRTEGARRPRRPALSAVSRTLREAPRTMLAGGRLVLRSRVLAGLLLVEVFWAVAMVAFETLTPLQLEQMLGGQQAAATVFGPASAAAWALFAAGSLLAQRAARTIGPSRTAILGRLLNGLFVIAMGLASGVVGLLVAYGLTYLVHGSAGPVHAALLHREADRSTRASVLSLNSMVSGGAYSLGLILLTAIAGSASAAVATVVAGSFSLLGALCYLPALRREQRERRERCAVPAGSGAARESQESRPVPGP